MEVSKEDIEKKQDELAEELCALLEKAGRGGASSRKFEIPEYARRRIDVSPAKSKVTGHFKDLVISDWKRRDHHDGDVPEERMTKQDILTGVAVFLKKHEVPVFADRKGNIYVLGIERYNGIPVEGYEAGHLYKLYSPERTGEAYTVTADGEPIASRSALKEGENVKLSRWFGSTELAPFVLTEQAYIKEMQAKSGARSRIRT